MTEWQLIIDAYNALPATDRTSRKVHEKLISSGHSVGLGRVTDVLSATVLSEALTQADVSVTAKTLATLLDFNPGYYDDTEPSPRATRFVERLTEALMSIAGPPAADLRQLLARVLRDYDDYVSTAKELDHIEYKEALRKHATGDDFWN